MKANELPSQNDPIPGGVYDLAVKEIERRVSETSKLSYLNIQYSVVSGEHKGAIIFDMVSLSPKALWKVKNIMLAFGEGDIELEIEKGIDGYIVDELAVSETISQAISGRKVEASVVVRPENKEKGWKARNEIEEYLPVSSTVKEPRDSKGWED